MKVTFNEWNERQKNLRHDLEMGVNFPASIQLFLEQHAMVHDSEMTSSHYESFADEIWVDLTEKYFRRIPLAEDFSIAWIIWHTARIEDITMNWFFFSKQHFEDYTTSVVPIQHEF